MVLKLGYYKFLNESFLYCFLVVPLKHAMSQRPFFVEIVGGKNANHAERQTMGQIKICPHKRRRASQYGTEINRGSP